MCENEIINYLQILVTEQSKYYIKLVLKAQGEKSSTKKLQNNVLLCNGVSMIL